MRDEVCGLLAAALMGGVAWLHWCGDLDVASAGGDGARSEAQELASVRQ